MVKTKKIKLSNRAKQELLIELWEDAAFNRNSYLELEKMIINYKKSRQEKCDFELTDLEILFNLSTSRNRNLINYEQQRNLSSKIVGFFGLSVGSHAAITWIIESRSRVIKISDPDKISPTNLNRLRLGWEDIGKDKVDVVKHQLLKINPYLNIVLTKKTDFNTINNIFNNSPKLSAVIDAIDDMEGKIILRKLAKENKIPLISAADVGDNIVLDIERYDQDLNLEPFLGRISKQEIQSFPKMSDLEKKKMIIKLVGFEENSEQMLDSLLALGKDLSTWPQLGATATIAGGIITTTLKKIFLGEKIKSGRYYFSLDSILVQDFNSKTNQKVRNEKIKQIKTKFKI
ncbi:ThiF family adenylyltransferase [Candidatus Daviesbacteria bacterium]|nr:ThiF family adenylyltransferase [Candidatus Daviesbacteria bacterium]